MRTKVKIIAAVIVMISICSFVFSKGISANDIVNGFTGLYCPSGDIKQAQAMHFDTTNQSGSSAEVIKCSVSSLNQGN